MSFTLEWSADQLTGDVLNACETVVFSGAEQVLKDAEANCPVESAESYNKRKAGPKAKQYGAKIGVLKKSGRIVKFRKKSAVGAYVKFGGTVVDGVDTYYGRFVELGTPGTSFKTKKGYWGHEGQQRVAVKAKPFIRPSLKKNGAGILNDFEGAMR